MAQIVLRFGTTGKAKVELTANQMEKTVAALAAEFGWSESDGVKELFVAQKCLSRIMGTATEQCIRTRQIEVAATVNSEERSDLGAVIPTAEV